MTFTYTSLPSSPGMYLTGHIPLKRMDRRSQMECLQKCREMLQRGVSVLFFPEGTRSTTWAPEGAVMADFKKGAFSVAAKEGVKVVPITLVGTGSLMPSGKEYFLKGGKVQLVIHPPIQSNDADELTKKARKAVASALPKGTY